MGTDLHKNRKISLVCTWNIFVMLSKFTNVLPYISTSSLCPCLASNDNRALFFASTERQIKTAEEKQDCRLHLSVKGLRPICKLCLLSCCHRNISELGDAFWIGFHCLVQQLVCLCMHFVYPLPDRYTHCNEALGACQGQ